MHHRMIVEIAKVAIRTRRMPPVGTQYESPPVLELHRYRTGWLHEDQRARMQHLGQGAWVILGARRNLGEGHVTGGTHEARKLRIGHWRAIDQERIHAHAMNGPFFRVEAFRAHAEHAAFQVEHIVFPWGERVTLHGIGEGHDHSLEVATANERTRSPRRRQTTGGGGGHDPCSAGHGEREKDVGIHARASTAMVRPRNYGSRSRRFTECRGTRCGPNTTYRRRHATPRGRRRAGPRRPMP